jgi:glyoxylase-like metal-dependent hydrolase (beta-lactamase superfamily II)
MIKVQQIADITRFNLAHTLVGRGRYWTSCYRVGKLMIDTGCAHTAHELGRALENAPLTCVVNTHSHEDHYGANSILQRQRAGLKILVHPLSVPILSDPQHCAEALQPYRRLFWGLPEPSKAHPVSDGGVIRSGNYHFQVIFTPGHSPDHLCIFEAENGWLFSGDLFSGGQDRALREGYNIWEIIASLKRIAALPIRILFPGSARVRENPGAELIAKITYLEELGGRVLEFHHRGYDVQRIIRTLLGGSMWVEVVTLGHFSRHNLVESYLKNQTTRVHGESQRLA